MKNNFSDGKNEMNYPKISVITVSYNSVKTIEQTISSVVNQEYKNIEYIIIDGGSTDGTTDIIKKYEKDIYYWVSEEDNGIYHAMNKGIDIAKGDYIHFLNSDDCYVDHRVLSGISDILKNNKEIDILSCCIWVVDEIKNIQMLYDNILNEEEVYQGKTLPHPGMIVKRKIMKENHFDEKYRVVSDYDFFLKSLLVKKYNFEFSCIPIVFFSNAGISSQRIRYQEHASIMGKYSLSPSVIKKMQIKAKNSFFYRVKRKIEVGYLKLIEEKFKYFLVEIGIRKSKTKKWIEHKCDLTICRWCKTKN